MKSSKHLPEVDHDEMPHPMDERMDELYSSDDAHYDQKRIGDTIIECCYRTNAGGRITIWEPLNDDAPDVLKRDTPEFGGQHMFPYRQTYWDFADAWEWYVITLTDQDGLKTFKQLNDY